MLTPILHEIAGATAGIVLTAIALKFKPYFDQYSPRVQNARAIAKALDIKLINDLEESSIFALINSAVQKYADDQSFSTQEVLDLIPEVQKQWSLRAFASRMSNEDN